MEYVWLIFGNLQISNYLMQFNINVPINLFLFMQSYSDIVNQNFVQPNELYQKLRNLTSDSHDPNPYGWTLYGKIQTPY